MNAYIATFYTHYGAIKFHSDFKAQLHNIKPMPVPRALSSSCGTCVYFESSYPAVPKEQEDLEMLYLVLPGGGYAPVEGYGED